MKFCTKCGKEMVDEAVVCPNCGCGATSTATELDAPNAGYAVLGFFIPIVGLILYLVSKDKTPLKAKSAGKGALIGFCTSIALGVIYGIIIGATLGGMLYSL